MRFFVNNYAYPGFVSGLVELGHEVIGYPGGLDDYNWWHHMMNRGMGAEEYNALLLRQVLETLPDVFLCGKGWHDGAAIWPETVEKISRLVRATVYWSLDDPDFVGMFRQLRMRRGYHIALTCCLESVEEYRSLGMDAHVFWPAWDQTEWEPAPFVADSEKACDFLIVGSPYTKSPIPRREIALAAKAAGMSLRIYGSEGWLKAPAGDPGLAPSYMGVWCNRRGLPGLFATSRVNVSTHLHRALGYLNDRVPIVMGAGQFLLCDRQPGLEAEFEDGIHLVYFDGVGDMVEKAKFYLAHRELREEIGRSARARILDGHTYRHRARQLLRILDRRAK